MLKKEGNGKKVRSLSGPFIKCSIQITGLLFLCMNCGSSVFLSTGVCLEIFFWCSLQEMVFHCVGCFFSFVCCGTRFCSEIDFLVVIV